jgi:hypothetical protein
MLEIYDRVGKIDPINEEFYAPISDIINGYFFPECSGDHPLACL